MDDPHLFNKGALPTLSSTCWIQWRLHPIIYFYMYKLNHILTWRPEVRLCNQSWYYLLLWSINVLSVVFKSLSVPQFDSIDCVMFVPMTEEFTFAAKMKKKWGKFIFSMISVCEVGENLVKLLRYHQHNVATKCKKERVSYFPLLWQLSLAAQ